MSEHSNVTVINRMTQAVFANDRNMLGMIKNALRSQL